MSTNNTLVASVPSTSGRNTVYAIEKHGPGNWTCSCPAFAFTKPDAKGRRFPCLHLRQAWKIAKGFKDQGYEMGQDKATGIVVYDTSAF